MGFFRRIGQALGWIFSSPPGDGGGENNIKKYGLDLDLNFNVNKEKDKDKPVRGNSFDDDKAFDFDDWPFRCGWRFIVRNNWNFILNRAAVGFFEFFIGGLMLGGAGVMVHYKQDKWFPYGIFVGAYVVFLFTRLTWVFYPGQLNIERELRHIEKNPKKNNDRSFSQRPRMEYRYRVNAKRLAGPCGRQYAYLSLTALEILLLFLAWFFYGLSEIFHQKKGLTQAYSALTAWLIVICFFMLDPALNVEGASYFQPDPPSQPPLRMADYLEASLGLPRNLPPGQDYASAARAAIATAEFYAARPLRVDDDRHRRNARHDARTAVRNTIINTLPNQVNLGNHGQIFRSILAASAVRFAFGDEPGIVNNWAVPWPRACVNRMRCAPY